MKHARPDYNRIQDPEGFIPEDEPVFLLRGQDIWASAAVRYYADLISEASPELSALARGQAAKMGAWARDVRGKTPDL